MTSHSLSPNTQFAAEVIILKYVIRLHKTIARCIFRLAFSLELEVKLLNVLEHPKHFRLWKSWQ